MLICAQWPSLITVFLAASYFVSLGFGENELSNSQFKIYSADNDNFTIKLTTDYNELITFSLYDINGKILVFNNIEKTNKIIG